MNAVRQIDGTSFEHAWQFHQALAAVSESWETRPKELANKKWNKEMNSQLSLLLRVCRVDQRRK